MGARPNKVVTQANILEAALTLFAEKGYDAVSVEEIGTAAGVGHGTIFWHFQNKQNLYFAVANHAGMAYQAYVHPTIDASEHPSDLPKIAAQQYRFLREHPKLELLQTSLVFECTGPHPELKPALDAVNLPYYEGWKRWVDKMQVSGYLREDVDPVGLVHTLTGGLGAIAIGGIVHKRDMSAAIAEYSRILVRGAFKVTPDTC
jgi:AcrR family transcriptional regulator